MHRHNIHSHQNKDDMALINYEMTSLNYEMYNFLYLLFPTYEDARKENDVEPIRHIGIITPACICQIYE